VKTLAAAVAALMLAGCTAPADHPAAVPSPARACGSPVRTDALPSWARTGFSWDGSGMNHVYGDRGDIVAILFGSPLRSPPAEDHGNKILWVSRQPVESPDQLEVTGVLDGTAERASQTVQGGPGPSIVDLPRPGCWRLTLSWSGRTDTMDLIYR
jgi:hypothetical protein